MCTTKDIELVNDSNDSLPKSNNGSQDKQDLIDRLKLIPCLGLFMEWISSIAFASASLTFTMMSNVDPMFVLFLGSLGQIAIFLPILLYYKDNILGVKGERYRMFERSFVGFTCLATNYFSLKFISLSDSQSIIFASPAFVSVLGCLLLNESCGIITVFVVITSVVGVFLVARPSAVFGETVDYFTPEEQVTGLTLAIFTCLVQGYLYISMRKLQRSSTSAQVTFSGLFSCLAASLYMNISSWTTNSVTQIPVKSDWMLLILSVLFNAIGMSTSALAFRLEEAGLVSIMRTFNIVMSFVYQAIFLPQPIHWTSIVGAFLICSGCIIVSGLKYWESKNKN